RFGASYLDAVYEEFTNAQIFNPLPAGGNAASITDVSGNTAMRSPEWTFKLGLDYERDLSRFGSLGAALNVDYNDGFFTDASNRIFQPAFTMVSASLRWVTPDGSARITLFGDNLLNEEVIQYFASSANGDFGALRAPRAYGVRVGLDF